MSDKLIELLQQYLTEENARQYASTNDKLIYCQDLTDLPLRSKLLDQFEEELWIYACDLGLCK